MKRLKKQCPHRLAGWSAPLPLPLQQVQRRMGPRQDGGGKEVLPIVLADALAP